MKFNLGFVKFLSPIGFVFCATVSYFWQEGRIIFLIPMIIWFIILLAIFFNNRQEFYQILLGNIIFLFVGFLFLLLRELIF
jgi:hypothetical protein